MVRRPAWASPMPDPRERRPPGARASRPQAGRRPATWQSGQEARAPGVATGTGFRLRRVGEHRRAASCPARRAPVTGLALRVGNRTARGRGARAGAVRWCPARPDGRGRTRPRPPRAATAPRAASASAPPPPGKGGVAATHLPPARVASTPRDRSSPAHDTKWPPAVTLWRAPSGGDLLRGRRPSRHPRRGARPVPPPGRKEAETPCRDRDAARP